jgi:hypothetical protein
MSSATDCDPRPGVPHANGAAYRRISAQVKTPHLALAQLAIIPSILAVLANPDGSGLVGGFE